MKSERELLEAAAKAAAKATGGRYRKTSKGIPRHHRDQINNVDHWFDWNPMGESDKALELAVTLRMEVYHADDGGWFAYASHPSARGIAYAVEPHGEDASAATRRAIVRAAAAAAMAG